MVYNITVIIILPEIFARLRETAECIDSISQTKEFVKRI